VLLNLDAGEHDDEPPALWQLADIVCIACGGHAGDEASMRRVLAVAREVGAHPSYPDREGFGRRTIAIDARALTDTIREQCARLAAVCDRVAYVKPHGALYHDANRDSVLARALIEGATAALGAVAVIGPARGALHDAAAAAGLRYLREGFADRATRPDGSLLPRSEPGALIEDPALAAARARELDCDTVCIHADTPGSLAIAHAVRAVLDLHPPRRSRVDWVPLGERAIRFARPPGASARAILRAARAWPGVVDVVVAREDVAVYFAGAPTPVELVLGDDAVDPPREHVLHATYDGADLADVARATGLSIHDVIDRHAARTYTVDTIGFRPGFGYLTGLDPVLALPRRETPRPRVPAGSLAIADAFTAVYPGESPGGWHLIGRVAEPMFCADGARLALGDRVRFVACG